MTAIFRSGSISPTFLFLSLSLLPALICFATVCDDDVQRGLRKGPKTSTGKLVCVCVIVIILHLSMFAGFEADWSQGFCLLACMVSDIICVLHVTVT